MRTTHAAAAAASASTCSTASATLITSAPSAASAASAALHAFAGLLNTDTAAGALLRAWRMLRARWLEHQEATRERAVLHSLARLDRRVLADIGLADPVSERAFRTGHSVSSDSALGRWQIERMRL